MYNIKDIWHKNEKMTTGSFYIFFIKIHFSSVLKVDIKF